MMIPDHSDGPEGSEAGAIRHGFFRDTPCITSRSKADVLNIL